MKQYDYDNSETTELVWSGIAIFDRREGHRKPIAWARDKDTAQRIVDALNIQAEMSRIIREAMGENYRFHGQDDPGLAQ